MLRRASRLVALPLVPVLVPQAKYLRRTVPILPPAEGGPTGDIPGPDPLRLLVFGDSTAVGVGAGHQDRALPGWLGAGIARRTGRGVHWTVVGESGATSKKLAEEFLGEALAEQHDLVFVTVGANDALKTRSRASYVRDLGTLLRALRERNPDSPILVSCFPVFGRFEALPEPLRATLYLHSRSLEDAGRALVRRFPNAIMSPPPPPYTEGFFATDRFHPSEHGYREWAEFALDDAQRQGLALLQVDGSTEPPRGPSGSGGRAS